MSGNSKRALGFLLACLLLAAVSVFVSRSRAAEPARRPEPSAPAPWERTDLAGQAITEQGVGDSLYGAVPDLGQTVVYLPDVVHDPPDVYSYLFVQNMNPGPQTVTLNFYDREGGLAHVAPLFVPAYAASYLNVEGLVAEGFAGSVVASAPASIGAVRLKVQGGINLASTGAISGATHLTMPRVQDGFGDFTTDIEVMNAGAVDTDVTIEYVTYWSGSSGIQEVFSETQTIPAGGARTFAGAGAISDGFFGTAEISSNSAAQPLVAVTNIVSPSLGCGGGYQAVDPSAGVTTFYLPLIVDRYQGWWNETFVQNVGTANTNVVCTYSGGIAHEDTATLAPGEAWSFISRYNLDDSYVGAGYGTSDSAPVVAISSLAEHAYYGPSASYIAPPAATRIHFPAAPKVSGVQSTTLAVQNVGADTAMAWVTFYDAYGIPYAPPNLGGGLSNPFSFFSGEMEKIELSQVPNLPDGQYGVLVSATLPIAGVGWLQSAGVLTGAGWLEGHVHDAGDDLPIVGAGVLAQPSGLYTTTDPTGYYTLTLPPAIYTITVSADGYFSYTTGISIIQDYSTTLDVDLEPAPLAPIPSFESISPVCLGEVMYFTNTTTGSLPLSYLWSLGDGVTSTLEHPSHLYGAAGPYTVSLQACNVAGCDTYTDTVGVLAQPQAGFTYTVTNLTVHFSNTSTHSNAYLWHLGDGTTSTETHPSHTYGAAGFYTVTLEAGGGCGTDLFSDTVVVGSCEPLTGMDVAGPSLLPPDTAATFTATTVPTDASPPIDYTWTPTPTAGQGTSVATYTWALPGQYSITVTAANCGGPVSGTHTVLVSLPLYQHTLSPTLRGVTCTSIYTLTNRGAFTATLLHQFYGQTGLVHSFDDQLGAGSARAYDLADVAELDGGYQGYLVVSADQPFTYTLDPCPTPSCAPLTGVLIDGPVTATLGLPAPAASPFEPGARSQSRQPLQADPVHIDLPLQVGDRLVTGVAEPNETVWLRIVQTGYQLSSSVTPDGVFRFDLPEPLVAGHVIRVQGYGSVDDATVQAEFAGLYTFEGLITPAQPSRPISYTWSPPPYSGQGLPIARYQWLESGFYTIALTAGNCGGAFTDTHTFTLVGGAVCTPVTGVDLTLTHPSTGSLYVGDVVQFSTDLTSDDASTPYTYTVYLDGATLVYPQTGVADPLTFSHTFPHTGHYVVAVAVWNCGLGQSGAVTDVVGVEVVEREGYRAYLPLVINQD